MRHGVIMQWKANKGLPYAEDMQTFEQSLAEAVGRDKGSKILTIGSRRIPGGGDWQFAYPGTLG